MPENNKARRKRKLKARKRKEPKKRNPYALIASMRSGAGSHGNGRPDKEESRNACRGKINPQDYLDEEDS